MLKKMKELVVKEEGQALTEYGLIIALVAVACITILGYLGDELKSLFNTVKNTL
jgi:pilus assembly protein Flp/PilA